MSPRDVEQPDDFVLQATPEMCCYCFHVLLRQLGFPTNDEGMRGVLQPNYLQNLPKSVSAPLFITWEKQRNGGTTSAVAADQQYVLRGCIGTLSPRPLSSATIGEYALTAALQDRRFEPIRAEEVTELRVAVSLLVQYERCDHVHDWEVGVHGILIKFTDSPTPNTYSATYLPEVAKEQGWTREEAVKSLIRKAGYKGQIHDNLLSRVHCTRYQSSKCRVTYPMYVESSGGTNPLLAFAAAGADNKKQWCLTL